MKIWPFLITSCISFTVFSQNPLAENGRLQVIGHQLCNQQGKPYQLKGVGMFGIMHFPQCITYQGFKVLRDDWHANVVRTPVYVANYSNQNNYNQNPEFNLKLIDSIVNWTEKLGLYCIIDWHVNDPYGDPNDKEYAGVYQFFEKISAKYANKQHVLYELCNEPSKDQNGKKVSWDTLANYANRLMPIIRKNAPNAIIIVGTPNWSQMLSSVNTASLHDTKNVMYSFHFYAASHRSLFAGFAYQIHRIPVFVTEWGACESSGAGGTDTATSTMYLKAMKQHVSNGDTVTVSWCNFSYADKEETASCLKPYSCYEGLWNNTTMVGDFVKYWLIHDKAPALYGR